MARWRGVGGPAAKQSSEKQPTNDAYEKKLNHQRPVRPHLPIALRRHPTIRLRLDNNLDDRKVLPPTKCVCQPVTSTELR